MKAIEEIKNDAAHEAAYETNVENIKRMLEDGTLSHDKIAILLNVPIELVEEIADGKAS